MANYKKKILKVSKGQIAPELIERTDIGLSDSSGQEITNFVNSKFGLLSSMPGTILKHTLGNNKIAKLFLINLLDGTDAALLLNLTDKTLQVYDCNANAIGTPFNIPSTINFVDLRKVHVAQNNELLLIASPTNPLLQIVINAVGIITDLQIFTINTQNILKSSVFIETSIDPVVIRLSDDSYPDAPETRGIAIGDAVLINQSGNPTTTFPWVCKRFMGYKTIDPEEPETEPQVVVDWQDYSYTPNISDYCYDEFDNTYWSYSQNSWVKYVSSIAQDITYNVGYKVNAVTGVIDATGFSITISKPDNYVGTPQQYAERLIIGCDFDGLDGLGIFRITKISGSTNGNNFIVNKISGTTYIAFAKADTVYNRFKITYSMRPAFDSDYPGTIDNIYSTQNYPLNIFFYQQRLYIVGTVNNPTQVLNSNVGTYNDFSDDYSGASTNSFQIIISGTEKETIQNIVLNQGLQIFTDKGEWVIADTTITKSSGFVRNSTIGSTLTAPIISANGITIFCPKQGVGIVGFIYNQDNASFNTPYISFLTNVFDTPVVDMNLKKGYSTDDDTLIYMCLESGALVIANYLQDQEIQSFVVRKSENALFKQTLQVENNVIMLVERNGILGIELQDKNAKTSTKATNFTYNKPSKTITGLPTQYNGHKVNVYDGDGIFVESVTVENNQAILANSPDSISEIGFNIHNKFVSNPQNINMETFNLYKTIATVKLALTERSNPKYLKVNGKSGRNKNGFITYIRPTRPLRKCQFIIENDIYPVDIMSIEIELEA